MRHRKTHIIFYRLFPLLAILIAVTPSLQGQNEDLKESFVLAEMYFLYEEYSEALPEYLKINRADPDNNNVNYKIGLCLLQDPFQKEKAIDYLLKASEDVNEKYKQNNFREKSAPPEVFYYLGEAYLINDSIDKALEYFNFFLDNLDEKVYDKELVLAQIATCERALELKKNPVDFDYENLGELVNSMFSDINPILSGDRSKLVYVSERRFYDASFYSENVDGVWQGGRMILPEMGVDEDVYPTCLSSDGKTMIIYRNDEFIGNLYESKLVDGQWTEMVKLGPNINTKYWESHGTLSKDGQKLYFTSNRKGGYGGLDIYVSEKLNDGTWGPPKNLGPTINTKYNEDTPFFTEDEETLYFSSFGHNNMGGYDIFYAKKQANNKWSEPVNVGFPINTTEDDLFFFPVNNGFNAYVAKYFDGGYGRYDIYYLTIYSDANPRKYRITGEIRTDEGPLKDMDQVTVKLIDSKNNKTIETFTARKGSSAFDFMLPKGDYKLLIFGDGYEDLLSDIRIDKSTDKKGIAFPDPLVIKHEHVPQTFTGELSRIEVKDSVLKPVPGDTTTVSLLLVENSSLTATHSVDSLEVRRDSFFIEEPEFEYTTIPQPGSNVLAFEMVEENGDTSLTEIAFQVDKQVSPPITDTAEREQSVIRSDEDMPEADRADSIAEEQIKQDQPEVKEDVSAEGRTKEQPEGEKEKSPTGTVMIFLVVFLVIVLFYLRRNQRKK